MKKVILLLLCILTLSCFVGCDIWDNHTHSFSQKADDIAHYSECSCGEITNREEHIFEWVIDVQPTYDSSGIKHEECVACGYQKEQVLIDKLLDEDIVTEGVGNPSLHPYKDFKSKLELLEFFQENKTKIGKSFLCFDAHSDSEKGLVVLNELIYKPIYSFEYEEEDENGFINPFIVVSFDLYADEWNPATDDMTGDHYYGGAASALVFYMHFYELVEENADYEFVFREYDNPNSTMEYVIEILDASKCIGNIYYYQAIEGEEISQEWIIEYIQDGLFVIE